MRQNWLVKLLKIVAGIVGLILGIILLLFVGYLVYAHFDMRSPAFVQDYLYNCVGNDRYIKRIPEFKVTKYRVRRKKGDIIYERHIQFKEPFDPEDIVAMDSLCKVKAKEYPQSPDGWTHDEKNDSYTYHFDDIGWNSCTDSLVFFLYENRAELFRIDYPR